MFNKVCDNIGEMCMSNDTNGEEMNRKLIASIIALVIILLIVLFLGKFLWNEVLCNLVSGTKKANSIWQILALYILLSILIGR